MQAAQNSPVLWRFKLTYTARSSPFLCAEVVRSLYANLYGHPRMGMAFALCIVLCRRRISLETLRSRSQCSLGSSHGGGICAWHPFVAPRHISKKSTCDNGNYLAPSGFGGNGFYRPHRVR